MNDALYLSRVRLRREPSAAALRPLLAPSGEAARAAAGHRLVWTLFADSPNRDRDFLWREASPGLFYVLSRRTPDTSLGLFEVDPPKAFAPALSPGDRLTFSLRANATVSRAATPGERGKPHDVVMNALRQVPPSCRPEERRKLMTTAGIAWLIRQGERHGFAVPEELADAGDEVASRYPVRVVSYRTMRVEHRGPPVRIGVLDFEGTLEVREPQKLLEGIANGFGRAKAFGCGLMLIRRATSV